VRLVGYLKRNVNGRFGPYGKSCFSVTEINCSLHVTSPQHNQTLVQKAFIRHTYEGQCVTQ